MALDAGTVEATLNLDLDDRGFREGDRRMQEWSGKSSSAQLQFNLDDRQLSVADRKLREWGMKSSTAELKFDVDRASLSRLIAGAGGGSRAIDSLATSAGDGEAGLARLGQTMQGLQWVGILAGAPAAAAALVNLGGAAVAVGSALSSLSGLLVTVPQGLLGFAQAGGTVALALNGVGDALKAYQTQQMNADKVTQQAAGREVSAAAARKSAAQQVTSAQQQVADANRAVGVSEGDLTIAHEQVTQAQDALNLAVEQAKRDMQDLRRAVPETATAEKDAHIALLEARRALDKGLRDPHTSGLELARLRVSVTEAEQAYRDAQISSTRARQDANKAEKEGVGGMPQVVAARQALTDAERGVATAARHVEDAERAAARAAENLAYQHEQARLHIEQSKDSMQAAATTANVYQQALDNLTPAQRKFVGFLVDVRERFMGLRQVAARNLFPGVTTGIEAALKNFPRLRQIVAETGKVLGHVATVVGKFVGSKAFGRDMSLFARTNLRLFERLGGAGIHFAHGLEIIMRDAQPFIRWLGRLTENLGIAFNQFARSGHKTGVFQQFFKETQRTLPQVLHLFKNLFSLLAGIGEAAAPTGNKIIGFFNETLRKWAEFSHSFTGKLAIEGVFERLREPFENLLKLAAALGASLARLFGSEEGQEMLTKLTDALIRMIPPVEKIGETIVEIISIVGPSALDLFASFLTVIEDGAPALAMFAQGVAFFARALISLIDAVPGLSQATGVVAAFGLAMAGVKWAAINSGIVDLGTGIYNVFKKGGYIEQAPGKVSAFMDALTAFPGRLKEQAGRVVASVKEVFLRIGSRLGLITGEKVAEETIGGEVAGEAGGGMIGKMKGLFGRARSALGRLFGRLGAALGLQLGAQAAEGVVGGTAAGEAGGGLIGVLRARFPKLSLFMERFGGRLGQALLLGLITLGLYEFHDQILDFFKGEYGFFNKLGQRVGRAIGTGIRSAINGVFVPVLNFMIDRVNDVINAFNAVPVAPNVGTIGHIGSLSQAPSTPNPIRERKHRPGIETHGGNPIRMGPHGWEVRGDDGKWRPLLTGGQQGGVVGDRGIVGFATGGLVGGRMRAPGPTDSVLAALTPGEIVLPRKASQAIQNAVGPITKNTEKVTRAILKAIRRDVTTSYMGLLNDVGDVEDRLERQNRDTFEGMHGDAKKDADGLHDDVRGSISDTADLWDRLTQQMLDQTTSRFSKMADTAQHRSDDLAGYVVNAMRESSGAVYQGVGYIAEATTKALKAFDSKTKFHLSIDKPEITRHATGGMIGGQGRQDNVPLLLGMAAPGEAILTRHQQRWVEAALYSTFGFGLNDLFGRERRSHAYEKGGKIPHYADGGRVSLLPGVNMSVGSEPQIKADLGKFAEIMRKTVYVISGYRSPAHSVAVGGFPDDPHTKGEAADIGLGAPTLASMASLGLEKPLNRSGLYRPFFPDSAAEANHVQLLHGAAQAAIGAAIKRQIGEIGVHGTAGPMRDLVVEALGLDRQAGNAFLGRQRRRAMPTAPGLGPSVALGPIKSMAHAMVVKEWDASQWPPFNTLEMHEASYDPNAENPSSGAYGIPQAYPASKLPTGAGPGSTLPMLEKARLQLRWMIGYIRSAYGTPAAAWGQYYAHPGGEGSYARGGFLGRAEERLRHLTHAPAIRHWSEALRHLRSKMHGQVERLQRMPRSQLHGKVGHALRDAIKAEQRMARRISDRIHGLHVRARDASDRIHHLQGRIAPRLIHGFDRAERIAGRGGDVSGLLDRLHIGRGLGSPLLRQYSQQRTRDVRNALAISRAQSPVLRTGSIFAGGGYVGGPMGGTNVYAAPPIYLLFDSDTDAFVGRVRAVQDGREQEISRKAGLGRMTPGAIGRKAVYAVPGRPRGR